MCFLGPIIASLAHNALGQVYFWQFFMHERASLPTDNDSPRSVETRLSGQEKPLAASSEFQQALTLLPTNADAAANLGDLALLDGDAAALDQALALAQAAVERAP